MISPVSHLAPLLEPMVSAPGHAHFLGMRKTELHQRFRARQKHPDLVEE